MRNKGKGSNIKYKIFISYKRGEGDEFARRLYDYLKGKKYKVFFDRCEMGSGKFKRQIEEAIDSCTDFIVIMRTGGFQGCFDKKNVYRKEILRAINKNKNIVPVMLEGFNWNVERDNIPPEMQVLAEYDSVGVDKEYSDAVLKKIYNRMVVKRSRGKKVLLSTIFFVAVIFTIIFIKVYVNEKADLYTKQFWDGNSSQDYAGGTGTKNNPYRIKTADELARLADQVDSGEDYKGKYFRLENDIYLSLKGNTAVHSWNPIGTGRNQFSGHFDGNKKTIYGMVLNSGNTGDYQGLFACCSESSVIENVKIVDAEISVSARYVGALVGQTYGLINTCLVDDTVVSGNAYVGGAAGQAHLIYNCTVTAKVLNHAASSDEMTMSSYDNEYFGGIAGSCCYICNSLSTKCYVEGDYRIGGIAGDVSNDIYNCVCIKPNLRLSPGAFEYSSFLNNEYIYAYGNVLGIYERKSSKEMPEKNIFIIQSEKGKENRMYLENSSKEIINMLSDKYIGIYFGQDQENANFYSVNYDYSVSEGKYNSLSKIISDTDKNGMDEMIMMLNKSSLSLNGKDIGNELSNFSSSNKILEFMEWKRVDSQIILG